MRLSKFIYTTLALTIAVFTSKAQDTKTTDKRLQKKLK